MKRKFGFHTNIKEFLSALVVVLIIFTPLSVVFGAGDIEKAYCHKNSGASEFVYHFNKAWDSHFDNNGTPTSGHELDKYTVEGDRNCDGVADANDPTPTITPSLTPTLTPSPVPTLTPTVTPLPSLEPTQTLSPTPTEFPRDLTATPTEVPVPTITPTVALILGSEENDVCTNIEGIQSKIPDGWFQNGENSTECRQFQYGGAPQFQSINNGQVLGISTIKGQVLGASTLASTGSLEDYYFMLGLILLGTSIYGLSITSLRKSQSLS